MKRSLVLGSGLALLVLASACTKPTQPATRTEATPLQSGAPAGSPRSAAALSVAPPAAPNGQRISGAEAKALVVKGATLVDVRTPSEFQSDGISGAVNIPYDQIEARAAELGPKDRPFVLYCHSGRRSGIAARTLVRLGYSSIYDLGPRSAW